MEHTKFGYLRALRLCFVAAPKETLLKGFLELTTGALTPILVLVVASFLDRAIAFAGGSGAIAPLIRDIVWMALGYAYAQVGQVLVRLTDESLACVLREKLRPELVRKEARIPYVLLEDPATLDLAANVRENAETRLRATLDDAIRIIRLAIQVIGTLSLLIARLWWMLPLYVLAAAFTGLVARRGGQVIYQMEVISIPLTRMLYYLSGVLTGRETAAERTLFGYTDHVNATFSAVHLKRSNMVTKELAIEEGVINISFLLLNLLTLAAVFGLLAPLRAGNLTHGLYVSLIGAMIGLNRLIAGSFAALTRDIAAQRAFFKDYERFLALPEEAEGADDLPDEAFVRLEIRNLRFRYAPNLPYVLDGVNLTIERGMSCSLIGRNGAGKSTLTKILLGLYRSFEGEILINGKDIASYSARRLRGMFSVVYQDFARYPVTFRENIALDFEGDFARAVRLAGLEDVVAKLPLGADTPLGKLGEDGVDLSGGEWQKMAIARALYADGSFLILDEPTASLSPTMEDRLYRRFLALAAGKTSLLISHRLGSTKLSDVLFVLDGGKIKETGSHATLMAAGGLYAEMFVEQRSWYDAKE